MSSFNDNNDNNDEFSAFDLTSRDDVPSNCEIATVESTRDYALSMFEAVAVCNKRRPPRRLKNPDAVRCYLSLQEVKAITSDYCKIDEEGRLHFDPDLQEKLMAEIDEEDENADQKRHKACYDHTCKMFDALMARIFSNIMAKLSSEGAVEVAYDSEENSFAFLAKVPQQELLEQVFSKA